jgi:hypothetical protein
MREWLEMTMADDIARMHEADEKTVRATHAYADVVLDGYFKWLTETRADDEYDFRESEVKLAVPGPVEGTELFGILDLAGDHKPSGDLFVMDTKVVASIDEAIRILHLNEQAPLYAILSKITDPDETRGFRVVWNFIKKTKQTARSKPPFYQRYELALNIDQLRQFWEQLHGQTMEILRTEQRLLSGESHITVAPPTPSRDCTWKCQYFAICGVMNDPRNDLQWMLNEYYTTKEQREIARLEREEPSLYEYPAADEEDSSAQTTNVVVRSSLSNSNDRPEVKEQ